MFQSDLVWGMGNVSAAFADSVRRGEAGSAFQIHFVDALVALGDHWGEGQYTRGARPGRQPLGVAFELTKGEAPADRVPPQGARMAQTYFSTGP